MMPTSASTHFLNEGLGKLYAKTALPIVGIMMLSGSVTLVDAFFLGQFVGPAALAAVSFAFPIYMTLAAFATLVSSGMSSIQARRLGAGRLQDARRVFAGAHGLACIVAILIGGAYLALRGPLTLAAAGNSDDLAALGAAYMDIIVLFSIVLIVLTVQTDALRNEGLVVFAAAISGIVAISNIGFNFLFIVRLDMGVSGSAYGTVLAQLLGVSCILGRRWKRSRTSAAASVRARPLVSDWGEILKLGTPQCLGFLGFGLGAAGVLASLQVIDVPDYEILAAAYGIVNRIMTFAFLPILGLAQAMQTITGTNFGAKAWNRVRNSLTLGLVISTAFCGSMQCLFLLKSHALSELFIGDAQVIDRVSQILPLTTALFVLAGPLFVFGMHLQAIGAARRAAVLAFSKPYLFFLPLTFGLAAIFGEVGVWLAAPASELLLATLVLTLFLTSRHKRIVRHRPSRTMRSANATVSGKG